MSSLFVWATRRVGGLAMIATGVLSYWVIKREFDAQRHGYKYQAQDSLSAPNFISEGAGVWASVFAYYCLLIHFLVFIFPIRSCWAIVDITRTLRKAGRNKTLKELKFQHNRRGSSTSLSSSETLTSSKDNSSSASSEAGDLDECYMDVTDIAPDRVIHAIVIPNYKEEMDTLRETLEVLGSHPQARNTYDVYLAMEQRESSAESKALTLIGEFIKKFRTINYTIHPADLPGETAGKGSNAAWAARELSKRYPQDARRDVIITGIDADSHLSSNFFAMITTMHMAYPDTNNTTMYTAPIIFDRNAHAVPAIVRVADIMWSAAGMSGLYRGSSIAPPTSVYSLPLELVDRVGGWDCDSEAIGEDLHMYLKCFFALNGHLTVRTVHSPVSQTNVTGGGNGKGSSSLVLDMRARYKQALRHMWGALDSGYAIRKFVELWQERKHTTRAWRPLHTTPMNNGSAEVYVPQPQHDAQDPEAVPEHGIFSDVTNDTLNAPDWERLFYLLHRLFEAHFLPVQMTIMILTSTLYCWVTDGAADVHGLAWIFDVCNVLRTAGFIEVAFYLFLYENFHAICAETREKEMNLAGLSKGMHFSKRELKKNLIDYVMVPLVAPLYGSIPCAQAQIQHFWTLDLVYTVSKKVTRSRAKSLSKSLSAETMV